MGPFPVSDDWTVWTLLLYGYFIAHLVLSNSLSLLHALVIRRRKGVRLNGACCSFHCELWLEVFLHTNWLE